MSSDLLGQTNRLLGYSQDKRLLIINADDLGMSHSINEAIFQTLQAGVVRTASLMPPCPWALHAIQHLANQTQIAFGVHLTVLCEHTHYRWGPLTCREQVSSLVDETGYFYSLERVDEFLAQVRLTELEREFRAQIERVLKANLKPTHLDWHCLYNGGRSEIFDLTLALATEYGLVLRVDNQPQIDQIRQRGLPTNDHGLMDSYAVDVGDKRRMYTQMLRQLPVGLTEWAVHPGLGNGELQAIEPASWLVRSTDYEFFMSAEANEVIRKEEIVLMDYGFLQPHWQR